MRKKIALLNGIFTLQLTCTFWDCVTKPLNVIAFLSHLLFSTTRVPCVVYAHFSVCVRVCFGDKNHDEHKFNVHHFRSFAEKQQHHELCDNSIAKLRYIFGVLFVLNLWERFHLNNKPSMESPFLPHEWTRCTQLQHFCRFKRGEGEIASAEQKIQREKKVCYESFGMWTELVCQQEKQCHQKESEKMKREWEKEQKNDKDITTARYFNDYDESVNQTKCQSACVACTCTCL